MAYGAQFVVIVGDGKILKSSVDNLATDLVVT